MADFVEFIRTCLTLDAETAHQAGGGEWTAETRGLNPAGQDMGAEVHPVIEHDLDGSGFIDTPPANHIARHDPWRVFRQVNALRSVLGELETIADRSADPSARAGARVAIVRLASIWGTVEELEHVDG